jgi:hypothetical protein
VSRWGAGWGMLENACFTHPSLHTAAPVESAASEHIRAHPGACHSADAPTAPVRRHLRPVARASARRDARGALWEGGDVRHAPGPIGLV